VELLETIAVRFGEAERRISLYHGDLTRLPRQRPSIARRVGVS
jgi:hypothetical protein